MGRDIVGFHRDQGASVRFLRELGYSQHQGLAALLHTGWDQAAAQRLLVNGVIFEVVATYWRARGRRRQRGPRPLLVFREQQGPLRLRPSVRGRGADRAGPFGGASSEARPHRVACAPVVSQAAQSGSAAVERYLVSSAPRAPDQRGFHHCMGRIGDAAAGSPWAAGRQAGGAPRAAAVRCERGRGGGALAGKVANADALPSLGPPSTEGSTEPTALPPAIVIGVGGLDSVSKPAIF